MAHNRTKGLTTVFRDETRTSQLEGPEECVVPIESASQPHHILCQSSEGNVFTHTVRRRWIPPRAFTDMIDLKGRCYLR